MAMAASKAVSAEVAASLATVRDPSLGLLLYGSHARGDQASTSDVDLLQLVAEPRKSYSEGAVSVVAYTIDQLRNMACAGSLFAWHLRTEGIILEDPDRDLENALAEHPGPATDRVLTRVRELSTILDVSREDLDRYGARLSRLARYLLRTAIYARSLEVDESSFALDLAAKAAHAESILPLLVRNASGDGPPHLIEYRDALVKLLGTPLTPNLFGSLEALVVNRWETDHQLAVMAVQAMSDDSGELDYELITFQRAMTKASLIGDVHGDVERLRTMLRTVDQETDRTVILLGDYVNRGPDPAGVLDLLSRLQDRLGERLVLLEGNHDRVFREFLAGADIARLLAMGGATTVRSYVGMARGEISGRLRASVPERHIKVLDSLWPMWCADDLIALHQWPDEHLEVGERFAVLGHYPQPDHLPRIEQNAAYLDTGCGSDPQGVLTCLRFPEGVWHSV